MTRAILEIERLGQRGEGIAKHSGRTVFVPFALAGERVLAEVDGERGRLVEVLTASSDRIAPICKHYGVCGGCAVQTLAPSAYTAWKRGLVVTALANAGISTDVAPLLDAHGAGRRRVVFHARDGAVGFMETRAHKLVEIDACPLLDSGLAPALDAARALARALKSSGKPLDIAVTSAPEGLDVDLRGSGALSESEARALVELAERLDIARLSNHSRVLALRRRPTLGVGSARLSPPTGGFLQATARGEEEMARLALQSIGKAKRVADLFCGSGAFALRLAEVARVDAFDESAEALAALEEAARSVSGAKPVAAFRRNLFENPLRAEELEGFDAVIFDPPRAGAAAQAAELARSKVPLSVAISCNAQSFARDAKAMIDGGFALEQVTPIDQFRYAAHIELVAVFRRAASKKRKAPLLSR
ncbi:class I SAM-dependent RNA methyltransferase [Methylocystis bryophila]|uniref:RNA methyltransferase n=1 Tax=Methylocystis bryophila TaxID=655015 RepID=A0A1W6MW97_9HYPH|nr:RsmD family RNA methyltransferase [Methylocystis bryophila]ARN81871.1 RNA methyltransferase [Methylocystis bryophila]BDV37950.1 putative RNA methyltransferase [Methylocystis bryophila]